MDCLGFLHSDRNESFIKYLEKLNLLAQIEDFQLPEKSSRLTLFIMRDLTVLLALSNSVQNLTTAFRLLVKWWAQIVEKTRVNIDAKIVQTGVFKGIMSTAWRR